MNPKPSKAGRPLTDETPAVGHIHLRVTMERKNRYGRAARKRRTNLTTFITDAADAACPADPPQAIDNTPLKE